MRIILAQINPTVGFLEDNQKKIVHAINEAKSLSADIVLFPELSLLGYPPEDLLLQQEFIDEAEKRLLEIAKETKGITAIVGTVRKNLNPTGKPLFNSAAILSDGKIIGFQDKILLPTYDVFDENRYFEPGTSMKPWDLCGKKIGITICEDIWQSVNVKFSDSRYHVNPVLELKKEHPDYILNLSGSPFSKTHLQERIKVCKNAAILVNCPLFYCNQVGANDSLIFDGYSMVFEKTGQLIGMAKGFEEDFLIVDDSSKKEPIKLIENSLSDIYQALVLGVRDYFLKTGFKKAVLGLSGGIDSALVACIGADALGADNVLCIAMPSRYSSKESLSDAIELTKNLNCHFKEISIEDPFTSYLNLLEPSFEDKPFDITEENMQARIRGMVLMAMSNKFQSMVLSTGNKSELALGYCTLYGDMCGGLAVIGDVMKSEVYALSKWINREKEIIPLNIIQKAPTAELKFNQKDQDTLPEYEIVDHVLTSYLEDNETAIAIAEKYHYSLSLVKDLIRRIHQNEYKRKQAPPSLRISKKAFTAGWRFPIAQKWI